ncbi:MAG: FtsK/SpoIIIE domain-containing protein [Clostridium paraputrificum]
MTISGVGAYHFYNTNERKINRFIKKNLNHFFEDKKIINVKEETPKIECIEIYMWGVKVTIDIAGICGVEEIEKHKDYLKQLFRVTDIFITNKKGLVDIEIVSNPLEEQNYKYIPTKPTELLLGYDFKGKPILADMTVNPHLLITGLSGQGKTGLLRTLITNIRDADVILCNCFEEDFRGFNVKRLYGEDAILEYCQKIMEQDYWHKRPLYLVVEELATIKDKKLVNLLKEMLCVCRHYNIFIIGIIQIATKEELKFKSYFISRLSFKQLDSSSYQVVLGAGIDKGLQKREFYCLTDGLYKGKTYTLPYK